jgi:hypothetical protein
MTDPFSVDTQATRALAGRLTELGSTMRQLSR